MTAPQRSRLVGLVLVGSILVLFATIQWQAALGQASSHKPKDNTLEKDWQTLKGIYGDAVVSVFAKLNENPVETGRLTGVVELFGTRYLQMTSKRVGTPTLIRVDIIQGIKQWNEP